MGLDMYAYASTQTSAEDFDARRFGTERIHYWRKHANLHGWMEQLYRERGGDKVFNCVALRLLPEDLDRLEAFVHGKQLPYTVGFFFGQSDGSQEEIDDDLDFITKAREAIAKGLNVFYSSWW